MLWHLEQQRMIPKNLKNTAVNAQNQKLKMHYSKKNNFIQKEFLKNATNQLRILQLNMFHFKKSHNFSLNIKLKQTFILRTNILNLGLLD